MAGVRNGQIKQQQRFSLQDRYVLELVINRGDAMSKDYLCIPAGVSGTLTFTLEGIEHIPHRNLIDCATI